jgi:hypothetical protein
MHIHNFFPAYFMHVHTPFHPPNSLSLTRPRMALHIGTALPLWIDIDLEIPTRAGGQGPAALPASFRIHSQGQGHRRAAPINKASTTNLPFTNAAELS